MVVVFDLNGTLTDPRAIGAVWEVPHAEMRTAFVRRDESLASAYPRPDIDAADLRELAGAVTA